MPSGTLPALPSQGVAGAIQLPAAIPGAALSGTSTSTNSTQSVTLKDGLSATVNIISQYKDNILIVSSRAITRQGQNSTVQVVKGTSTETRIVKTGMTDGTSTEITEGLSEGEQVVIKSSTSTTSSTTTRSNNAQSVVPGLGGGPPGGGF
jgi:macrolide-specific efflux system membrane fusion protein